MEESAGFLLSEQAGFGCSRLDGGAIAAAIVFRIPVIETTRQTVYPYFS
jgi:hypothetical protein